MKKEEAIFKLEGMKVVIDEQHKKWKELTIDHKYADCGTEVIKMTEKAFALIEDSLEYLRVMTKIG